MDFYLVTSNGTRAGPYSLAQMQAFWVSGKLTRNSLYWTAGLSEWKPVRELEHHFQLASTPRATPPLAQSTRAAEKPKRKSLGCGQGCLILFVLLGGFVAVLGLLPADKEGNASGNSSAPSEITIDTDLPVGSGVPDNFVLRDEKDVKSFITLWQSLGQSPDPDQYNDSINGFVSKALRDGTGTLIPAGTYRITGFLGMKDGQRLSKVNPGQMVFAQIDVNGRAAYRLFITPY
jgi:hypothetical protein